MKVKIFNGSISDLGFLESKMNSWLDNHPRPNVKFATQTVHHVQRVSPGDQPPKCIIMIFYEETSFA